jgi:hypothetical protein
LNYFGCLLQWRISDATVPPHASTSESEIGGKNCIMCISTTMILLEHSVMHYVHQHHFDCTRTQHDALCAAAPLWLYSKAVWCIMCISTTTTLLESSMMHYVHQPHYDSTRTQHDALCASAPLWLYLNAARYNSWHVLKTLVSMITIQARQTGRLHVMTPTWILLMAAKLFKTNHEYVKEDNL